MITTAADIAAQPSPDHLTLDLTREETSRLISALSDQERTLGDIALEFNTTIEAISIFAARPDIAQRLDDLESLSARRIRLYAAKVLPTAIDALNECVRTAHWEETHVPPDRSSAAALEQRRRARETTRKATSLLARLARFGCPPPREKARAGSAEPHRRGRITTPPPATHPPAFAPGHFR